MSIKDEIIFLGGGRIKDVLSLIKDCDFDMFEEIRFRAEKPAFITKNGVEYVLSENGELLEHFKNAFIPSSEDINIFVNVLSGYSLYAFEEEIKNGYITVEGGHRVGISGKAIVENGQVLAINNFYSINIRISHEIKGCAKNIVPFILNDKKVINTIIVSPPGVGKTTLLRDIIRILSKSGKNISVADERGEIAGSWQGITHNDIGPRTDVMDSCPKKEGMLTLLRSMSPEVIAVDELGREDDIKALDTILSAGVSVICTVHGKNAYDAFRRIGIEKNSHKEYFGVFIELKRVNNSILAIIKDDNLNVIGKELIR